MRIFALLSFLFLQCSLSAQPSLEFVEVYDGFSQLVDISNAGDGSDRLFIVEKRGIIKIIENGVVLSTPFLDIDSRVNSIANERGLLGLEFHPQYETNGYFYVNYTNNSGTTIISRFNVSSGNANLADANSEKIMLQVNQPYSNHNAGDLKFSPVDGYLYIPLGDGGSGGDPMCKTQDSTSYLGKLLRLDVDQNINTTPYYGIPADNPYISTPSVPDEVWAFGLRNPWKVAFDAETGDLWMADVGQNNREEVNRQLASSSGAENYGWPIMEGNTCYDPAPINSNCPAELPPCFSADYVAPIASYPQNFTAGGYSITGGYVYRGCKYSELYGYYIATDYVTKNTWAINQAGVSSQMIDSPIGVSTFGETENKELYMATLSGRIYEVRETTFPETLTLTSANNPLSGVYQAACKITVGSNVTINANSTVSFIAPQVDFADDVNIPSSATLIMKRGACDE